MLVLKNLQRKNGQIEADYYPENKGSKGHLVLKISDGTVVSHEKAVGYEHSSSASHAKRALLKLANSESLPSEKIVSWY